VNVNSMGRDTAFVLRRAALVLIVVATALGVATQLMSRRFVENSRKNEADLALQAVLGSSLQLYRNNAVEITARHLSDLMNSFNKSGAGFYSALIAVESGSTDEDVSWKSQSKAPERDCLRSLEKSIKFEDGIYPYRVVIHYDSCWEPTQIRNLRLSVVAVSILMNGIAMIAIFVAISPLLSALYHLGRFLSAMERKASHYSLTALIAQIKYTPVSTIATAMLRVQSLEREAAIARTTQMLAHDVRKPFSMIIMAMNAIRSSTSLADVKLVSQTMLPEVEQAMLSVNGLIEDVMEVGGSGNLIVEDVDPVALARRCVNEAVRVHSKAEFTLERNWNHAHSIRCDERKVARVFSNVVGNAIQAMPSGGLLWIRTQDLQIIGSDFIEFAIGNSGSFIDHESLPQLFEAFFTKNKKGGTGLGLAIAHKIVTSHGGTIACRSERNDAFPTGMVEFKFTLPAGDPVEKGVPDSITTAHVLRAALATESMATLSGASAVGPFAEDELRLEGEVERSLSSSCRMLEVLIVDDEKLYRDGLKNQLTSASSLASSINLTLHDSADAVHGFLSRQTRLDLAILDVDIGSSQVNGFDLAKCIRDRFPKCIVCIHSNRNLSGDHRTALEHGADAFQPKPMVRPHLLKLLLQASTAVAGNEPADSVLDGLPIASSTQLPSFGSHEESVTKRIAVVDDSEATLISWRLKIGSKDADFFSCPEKFLRHANEHSGYFLSLACIVSDFNFGTESEETGITFARLVRQYSDVPFFLSSNQNFEGGVPDPSISGLIPKATMARQSLLDLASKAAARG